MKFIRDDGRLYDIEHADTIERLNNSERFERLERLTVKELREYAKKREISGYSSMKKEELIEALK